MEAALMGGSAALLPGLGLALVFYVNGVLDRREARRDRRHPLARIKVRTADCPACRGSGWQMYTSRGLVAMQPADVWRVPAVACTECGGRGKLVLAA